MYELAKESFTSPATVVRLCKKIDIKGFARLKVLLAEETKYFQDMKLNLLDTTTIEKNDSPHAIIEKITNIAVKTIEETRVLVNEKPVSYTHLSRPALPWIMSFNSPRNSFWIANISRALRT